MYANMLVDRNNPIGQVPYLDELIDLNDDCIYVVLVQIYRHEISNTVV